MQIEELRRMSQAHGPVMPAVHTDGSSVRGTDQEDSRSPRVGFAPGEASVNLAGYSRRPGHPTYDKNSITEESLIEDIAGKAASFSDAQTMKQELSMAASGVSEQDIEELKENGYSPKDMDAEGIRTVTDQIKEQLAKGGVDMGAMAGLSTEQLEEIPGGEEAYNMALELAESPLLSAEGMAENPAEYLVTNQLEPTIENIHQAVYSAPALANPGAAEVDMKALEGEIKKVVDAADLPADEPVMEEARELLSRDIPLTPENLSYYNELRTSDFSISEETIIEHIQNAVSEGRAPGGAYLLPGYSLEEIAASAMDVVKRATVEDASAVLENGRDLTIADLSRIQTRRERGLETMFPTRTVKEDSEDAAAEEPAADPSDARPAEIHAKRLLEETRLVMTTRANLSLLKRGVSIDTTELSQLVEDLKYEEQAFYRSTLSESSSEEELARRIDLFETTNQQVAELKELPAVLLGKVPEVAQATIGEMVDIGRETAARFQAAGERYEIMATEVRRDLGDSMQKAFRNVDDILEDMDLETSEGNRRAVRILAYNHQEITTDAVLQMREADEKVARAFKNLTPGVVAKMIRQGENPLDLSIDQLNEKAGRIRQESSMDSDEEKYSEFLWKAQQANQITEEERDAFIGVYRLIYQVEKTDGAVIGQLLGQGADITLRNMMSAVRTRRGEGREYTIDDGTEGFASRRTELTITEQIEKAFMTQRMKDAGEAMTPGRMQQFDSEDSFMNMNPDQFASALERMEATAEDEAAAREYREQTAADIRAAVDSEQRIYDILSRFDVAASPANLEAINEMLKNRNGMFMRLFPGGTRRTFSEVSDGDAVEDMDIGDVKEDILEAFGEAVKTPKDMAEAQMKLEEIATNVMRDFLIEQKVRQMDVRGMQVSINQIRAMGEMGKRSETYAVPIMVADTMGNLSLKIVRGEHPERGAVDVALDMESIGAVSMSLQVDAEGVSGSIQAERRETLEMLLRHQETIASAVGVENVSIDFSVESQIDANAIYDKQDEDYAFPVAARDAQKPEVQTRTLYNIARSLIDAVAGLE